MSAMSAGRVQLNKEMKTKNFNSISQYLLFIFEFYLETRLILNPTTMRSNAKNSLILKVISFSEKKNALGIRGRFFRSNFQTKSPLIEFREIPSNYTGL